MIRILLISGWFLLVPAVSWAFLLPDLDYHYDAQFDEYMEYEMILEEFAELGLDIDAPEFEGLDNGDLWRIIDQKKPTKD